MKVNGRNFAPVEYQDKKENHFRVSDERSDKGASIHSPEYTAAGRLSVGPLFFHGQFLLAFLQFYLSN